MILRFEETMECKSILLNEKYDKILLGLCLIEIDLLSKKLSYKPGNLSILYI
jgi:hypothetical protein